MKNFYRLGLAMALILAISPIARAEVPEVAASGPVCCVPSLTRINPDAGWWSVTNKMLPSVVFFHASYDTTNAGRGQNHRMGGMACEDITCKQIIVYMGDLRKRRTFEYNRLVRLLNQMYQKTSFHRLARKDALRDMRSNLRIMVEGPREKMEKVVSINSNKINYLEPIHDLIDAYDDSL